VEHPVDFGLWDHGWTEQRLEVEVRTMGQSRSNQDLIDATLAMVEANEAYQGALATNAVLLRRLAERLGAGEEVEEVVRSSPGKPGRAGAKRAEDLLEESRSRFRIALVSACLACDFTRQEIADNMGCSRQLVDRYARAAHEAKQPAL
jgi:hypothetical protein